MVHGLIHSTNSKSFKPPHQSQVKQNNNRELLSLKAYSTLLKISLSFVFVSCFLFNLHSFSGEDATLHSAQDQSADFIPGALTIWSRLHRRCKEQDVKKKSNVFPSCTPYKRHSVCAVQCTDTCKFCSGCFNIILWFSSSATENLGRGTMYHGSST